MIGTSGRAVHNSSSQTANYASRGVGRSMASLQFLLHPTLRPPDPLLPPLVCCSGAADWYWALPPITRALLTCWLATGLAAYLGALPIMYLYHDWNLYAFSWKLKRVPQVRCRLADETQPQTPSASRGNGSVRTGRSALLCPVPPLPPCLGCSCGAC